jgi:predicted phosphodiesterase
VFWEGSCSDVESKLYYRLDPSAGFDIPDNFEYTALSSKRHLFAGIINNVPGNATVLEYYVTFKKQSSSIYRMKTVPDHSGKEPLRVAVIGDSQLGVSTFRKNLRAIKRHHPSLFVHLGDAVQEAHRLPQWHVLLFSPLKIITPIAAIFLHGNHDSWARRPSQYLHDRQKSWHSIAINGAKLFILDSERETTEQTRWLEQELQTSSGRPNFKIVLVHVPPYIEYWDPVHWKKGDKSWPLFVRKTWVPLFKKYQVDLVLSGHQHNYQRGYRDGVHYIVSGGGGSKLDTERVEDLAMYKVTAIRYHFLIMDIYAEMIKVAALTAKNELIDELVIEKRVTKRYAHADGK